MSNENFWCRPIHGITEEDVRDLVDVENESARLEFKAGGANTNTVTAALAALANSEGGRLIVGVRDAKDRAIGVFDPLSGSVRQLENKALQFLQACTPPVDAEHALIPLTDGRGHLLVFDVPQTRSGVHQASDGVFYCRAGAASVKIGYSDIAKRFQSIVWDMSKSKRPYSHLESRLGDDGSRPGEHGVVLTRFHVVPRFDVPRSNSSRSKSLADQLIARACASAWKMQRIGLDGDGIDFQGAKGTAFLAWHPQVNGLHRDAGTEHEAPSFGQGFGYIELPLDTVICRAEEFLALAGGVLTGERVAGLTFRFAVQVSNQTQRHLLVPPRGFVGMPRLVANTLNFSQAVTATEVQQPSALLKKLRDDLAFAQGLFVDDDGAWAPLIDETGAP